MEQTEILRAIYDGAMVVETEGRIKFANSGYEAAADECPVGGATGLSAESVYTDQDA